MGTLSTFLCAQVFGRWGRLYFGWGDEGRHKACPYGSVY